MKTREEFLKFWGETYLATGDVPSGHAVYDFLNCKPEPEEIVNQDLEKLATNWAVSQSKTNVNCPACGEDVLWPHVAADFKAGYRARDEELRARWPRDTVSDANSALYTFESVPGETTRDTAGRAMLHAINWLRSQLFGGG